MKSVKETARNTAGSSDAAGSSEMKPVSETVSQLQRAARDNQPERLAVALDSIVPGEHSCVQGPT